MGIIVIIQFFLKRKNTLIETSSRGYKISSSLHCYSNCVVILNNQTCGFVSSVCTSPILSFQKRKLMIFSAYTIFLLCQLSCNLKQAHLCLNNFALAFTALSQKENNQTFLFVWHISTIVLLARTAMLLWTVVLSRTLEELFRFFKKIKVKITPL